MSHRVGLDQALKLLAYPIKNSGVKVERRYDDDTPEIEAYGGMLNQVWTNLIDNALDAMPGGGTLALVARPDGDHVLVEVIDTGTGIAPEKVGRVFDPFFTTKGVGEGTGLGLDLVRRIVETTHRGRVAVRSAPGCTNFTVRLPLRPVPEENEHEAPAEVASEA